MALIQALAIKTVLGDTDLELKADPGESFLIKDIRIYNPASNYVTLQTSKTTIGYYRVGAQMGSHLPFVPGRSLPRQTAHGHTAWTVDASETAGDITAFVPIIEGDGTVQAGVTVGHAGGGTDIDIMTSDDIATLGANVPMPGQMTLFALMQKWGLLDGYPVAVGETFKITGAKQANAIQMVTYEIYDEEDMKAEMPNGSRALEYIFINYGHTGASITAPGSHLFDTTLNPGEFADFPFGKTVPAKTEVDLIAILASDFAPSQNDGSDSQYTQYLKLIAERETLFDEDRNGLLFLGPSGTNVGGRDRIGEGQSLFGNYSDVDMNLPFRFVAPLTYKGGDDLDIYVTTAGAGTYQDIEVGEQEIALILKVRRAE
jgi:hypothetical protein